MNYQYYIFINGQKKGPYSYDDLKILTINNDTLIWRKGFDEWLKASTIEEVKELLDGMPPPLPSDININTRIEEIEFAKKEGILKRKAYKLNIINLSKKFYRVSVVSLRISLAITLTVYIVTPVFSGGYKALWVLSHKDDFDKIGPTQDLYEKLQKDLNAGLAKHVDSLAYYKKHSFLLPELKYIVDDDWKRKKDFDTFDLADIDTLIYKEINTESKIDLTRLKSVKARIDSMKEEQDMLSYLSHGIFWTQYIDDKYHYWDSSSEKNTNANYIMNGPPYWAISERIAMVRYRVHNLFLGGHIRTICLISFVLSFLIITPILYFFNAIKNK